MEPSLEGWSINRGDDVEWGPWGSDGKAQGKVLGSADGFFVVLVRNQGQDLSSGDGYAASTGSTHDEFGTATGATYLSIFKL